MIIQIWPSFCLVCLLIQHFGVGKMGQNVGHALLRVERQHRISVKLMNGVFMEVYNGIA